MNARRIKEGQYLRETVVSNTNINTAITLAVYLKVNAFDEPGGPEERLNIMGYHNSGGTASGYLLLLENGGIDLWNGSVQRESKIKVTPEDGDCIIGITKASGTVKAKAFKYRVGTKTWTVEELGATQGNATAVGTSGTVRFNEFQGSQRGDFTIYAAAVWNVAKTEAEFKELASKNLLEWKTLGEDAKEVWFFNQASTAEESVGLVSGSKQAAISGTEVVESTQAIPYEESGATVQGKAAITGTGTLTAKGSVLAKAKPTVTAEAATEVKGKEAVLNATVNMNGVQNGIKEGTIFFEWGTTTSYGSGFEEERGSASYTPFTVNHKITGLTPGTLYHFRVVATNSLGTTNGADGTFTTESEVKTVQGSGSLTGTGALSGKGVATRKGQGSVTGTGTLSGSGTVIPKEVPKVSYRRKPPLELDVEVETASGTTFRLSADSPKAKNRPSGLSFTTERGNGFGTGTVQLSRQIFRDYPDVGLLDTWRMVGRQGDIAYEGRLHSNPRTNSPNQQINVSLVGWMSYLKSRRISPLIIDRRLSGWQEPSTARRGYMLGLNHRWEASPQIGWKGEGALGPGVMFSFTTFDAIYTELGEAWFYAGGENIGALRYDFQSLLGAPDETWTTLGYLCVDDTATGGYKGAADSNKTTVPNIEVTAGSTAYKYALLQESYAGAFAGTTNEVHGFVNPRVVGTHGLIARGVSPTEGYYISDIIRYILNTYYPKINTEHIQENPYAVQQATWHDTPADGSEIISQLNDLVLWEENIWENRSYHYEPADLTKTDWQIRTDDPGVTVNFQGESIENFANGVVVTYNDFFGIRHTLYPDQHPELRDPNENNAATEHGENLWTDVEVSWATTEPEALQFGRAYLAEYNRPKRPGQFTVAGGYIQDSAGHWRQAWNVRNSQTLSIMDHPSESEPRLITGTSWDDETKTLTITVDTPPRTFDAVVARTVLELGARNLG